VKKEHTSGLTRFGGTRQNQEGDHDARLGFIVLTSTKVFRGAVRAKGDWVLETRWGFWENHTIKNREENAVREVNFHMGRVGTF